MPATVPPRSGGSATPNASLSNARLCAVQASSAIAAACSCSASVTLPTAYRDESTAVLTLTSSGPRASGRARPLRLTGGRRRARGRPRTDLVDLHHINHPFHREVVALEVQIDLARELGVHLHFRVGVLAARRRDVEVVRIAIRVFRVPAALGLFVVAETE